MADVTVRKDGGAMAPATTREIDPWRAIRSLMRWDPFGELTPAWPTTELSGFMPAFEVKETKTGFVLRADLPGVKESDLDVSLTHNRLTISGKREAEKQEKNDTYYVYERSSGSFTRTFTLPADIDDKQIHAELKNGVLTIDVAKKAEAQARKIAVATGETKKS